MTGDFLIASPGEGRIRTAFVAEPRPPESPEMPADSGLWIGVITPDVLGLYNGDPIYYRGVKVGEIRTARLQEGAKRVQLNLLIYPRYHHLIRANTRFWPAVGVEFKGGLFSEWDFKSRNLEEVFAGGLHFATPEPPGAIVEPGAVFELSPSEPEGWRRWEPEL